MDDVLAYTIIGASIGGFFAILGVVISNFIQYRKEKELRLYSANIDNYINAVKLINSLFLQAKNISLIIKGCGLSHNM